MAAWMEEDDASELQDYLQGLQSRVKGGNVDWKMIMEGGSALVRDRTGARGLGGKSKRQVKGNEGGSRFLKGSSTVLKRKEENTYASVGSTMRPTNEFLKNHVMPQSPSDCSRQVSSFASSLLSDDQPSEREKQSLAPVASIAHTSLHSDASVLESAEDTRSSIASDSASPQSCRKEDTGSPCTPSTVAVDLPRVQFAADLTSSSSSVAPELVATANSVSEQLSTVATEAVGDAPRSRQDGSQESGQEEEEDAGYRDDTFEDVSLLGDSDVECRTDNQDDQVEHDYGDSDFEESSAESSSRVSDEDEDDSRSDEERTSIEDQSSPKEASHSVVIPQSKSVPSAPPPTKTSSTGVQTDDGVVPAISAGVVAPPPPPPPPLSVLHSLLTMPTISVAGGSLHPPSAVVLDDLLRQHIHLARQSMNFTRAVAGKIEASLNTNHSSTLPHADSHCAVGEADSITHSADAHSESVDSVFKSIIVVENTRNWYKTSIGH